MLVKPMLAFQKTPDFSLLKFPLIASPKLDGIRVLAQEGKMYARSLKPIRNKNVQEKFQGLPPGLDGELIVGDPCTDPYRRTESIVCSSDKPADDVHFWVFDRVSHLPLWARLKEASDAAALIEGVEFVEHRIINTPTDLEAFESECLSKGYEGAMVGDPNGRYKHGRSGLKEGLLIKIKRFDEIDGMVIDYYEEMENQNEAQTNELGRTFRSSHKENKVGLDTLGGLVLRGLGGDYDGIEFRCGNMGTDTFRKEMWEDQKNLKGRIAKIKYFPTGSKDKPRFPTFLGWRDERDM